MKKVLLTGLIVSALSSTAFAAAPVTNFQAGESAVQLHYSFGEHNDIQAKDDEDVNGVKGKHNFGFALSTALNDKWALQYSYNPLLNSKDILVDSDDEEVAAPPAGGAAAAQPAAQPAPAVQPAGAQPAAPAKKAEVPHTYANFKVQLHQLQGIYKANENVNVYLGVDHLRTKVNAYGLEKNEKENKLDKFSESYSKSRTGVSTGVIAHTKLGEKTTAFAQLGLGTVIKYEAKFGISHDLSKDVSLVAAYEIGKYKLGTITEDVKADLKHRGVNLAVNYKF